MAGPFAKLTARERQVALLLCLGRKPHEIAEALGISTKTYDTHRGNILEKLGLRNNVELLLVGVATDIEVADMVAVYSRAAFAGEVLGGDRDASKLASSELEPAEASR
jgi:DNA-binding CsgD family transcriptional regulator